MKTPEEINEFLALNNIELNKFNSSQSFKSNYLEGNRNFKSLVIYLSNTLSFIKNLYETIDIDNIVQSVLVLLESNKNILNISVNLVIGNSVTQNIGSKIYRITRVDNYQINITSDNIINWETKNLIIQVKTIEGMVVYPTIVTTDNKIELYFNDLLGSNYKIFWI